MRYFVASAIVLLLATALPSCSDNPTSSNTLKGTLTLVVSLKDQDGHGMSDNSGVDATLDGTDRTATSDGDGFLSFPDLPAGTYVVTLKKPGYSTFKIYGVGFVGGGTGYVRDIFITEIPSYSIDQFTARVDTSGNLGDNYVSLTGTISSPAPENSDRTFRVFFDTVSTVNPTKYLAAGSVTIGAGHSDFQRLISLTTLQSVGVPSGARIYVVGYPASVWTLGYFDPDKRHWVEANLAPQGTQPASFMMP